MFRIIFILLFIFSSYVFASIGKITALRGEVQIKRFGISLQGKKGFKIEKHDIISTTKNARAQMLFNDGTFVSIGKASILDITDYLYNTTQPKKSLAKFKFTKGAYKFITGKIGKLAPERFKIKTKSATIGIRGTVLLGNQQAIACTQGEITVSSNGITQIVSAGMMTQTLIGAPPTVPVEYVVGAIDIGGINGNGVKPNNDSKPKDSKQNSDSKNKKKTGDTKKDKTDQKNKSQKSNNKSESSSKKSSSEANPDTQAETETIDGVDTNTIDPQALNEKDKNPPDDIFLSDLEMEILMNEEISFDQMDEEFNAFFDSLGNEFDSSVDPVVGEFIFPDEFLNGDFIESNINQNGINTSTGSGTTTITTLANAPSYKSLSGSAFKAYTSSAYETSIAITSDMKKMKDNSDGTIQAGYYVLDYFNQQDGLFSTTLWDFDIASKGSYSPYTHTSNYITREFNQLTGYKSIAVLGVEGGTTTNFANSNWKLAVIGADNTGEFISMYFQDDTISSASDALQYKGSKAIMSNINTGKVYGYNNFANITAKKTIKNTAFSTSRTYFLGEGVTFQDPTYIMDPNTPSILLNTNTNSLKDLNMLMTFGSKIDSSSTQEFDPFKNDQFIIESINSSDGTFNSKKYTLSDDYYKNFLDYVTYSTVDLDPGNPTFKTYSKNGSLYGTNLQGIGYTWDDTTQARTSNSNNDYIVNKAGTTSAYLTDSSTLALSGTATMSGFAVTNDGVNGDFSFDLNRNDGAISNMNLNTTTDGITGETYSVVLEGSGTVASLSSYYVNDDYFGAIFNNTGGKSIFKNDLGGTDTEYTLISEKGWFFSVADTLNQNTGNWETNNDDGSSWGFWAASFEKSGPLYKHIATTSPWVAGTVVSSNDVNTNYIDVVNQTVTADFSGHVLGNVTNGTNIEQIHMDSSNSFTANLNFSTQSFTADIAFSTNSYSFDTKLTGANGSVTSSGFDTSTIDTANFGAASITPTTANLSGKYYGSGSVIQSIGGTFQLSDGTTTANGVFKAKKQ